MGNISEMERITLLERQREGIAIAKVNDTYQVRTEDDKEFLHKYKNVMS